MAMATATLLIPGAAHGVSPAYTGHFCCGHPLYSLQTAGAKAWRFGRADPGERTRHFMTYLPTSSPSRLATRISPPIVTPRSRCLAALAATPVPLTFSPHNIFYAARRIAASRALFSPHHRLFAFHHRRSCLISSSLSPRSPPYYSATYCLSCACMPRAWRSARRIISATVSAISPRSLRLRIISIARIAAPATHTHTRHTHTDCRTFPDSTPPLHTHTTTHIYGHTGGCAGHSSSSPPATHAHTRTRACTHPHH